MKVIPLASRLTPSSVREKSQYVYSLVGKSDKKPLNDVCRGLFEHGFDLYLEGDIVANVFQDPFRDYSKIEVLAVIDSLQNVGGYTNYLANSSKNTGSDKWMHFGMRTHRQEGMKIRDFYHGTKFYCDKVGEMKFLLTPTIYSGQPPSPIHLTFASSLEGFEIV